MSYHGIISQIDLVSMTLPGHRLYAGVLKNACAYFNV